MRVNFFNVEVRREWKNIDVLIVLEKKENPKNKVIICGMKNKIKSKEQNKQLKKYKNVD